MPVRLETFLNNSIYHTFTRSIDSKIIFQDNKYPNIFLRIARYYRSAKAKPSFSNLSRLREEYLASVEKEVSYHKYFRVDILAYCLMPTHFHLLIKQKETNGISRFMSDVLNSFTRYYNIKNRRKGPIFLPHFKSSSINNHEQYIHVSRYIHLNPYSGGIVTKFKDLENYPWSSFSAYVKNDKKDELICSDDLLSLFNFNKNKYRDFVFGNAQYQKTLELAKFAQNW